MPVRGSIKTGVKLDGGAQLSSHLNKAGDRALVLQKRILERAGMQIATQAKHHLQQIKNPERDPATRGKGKRRSLVNAIMSDRVAKRTGRDLVYVNVYWGLPYGKILEDGPAKVFAWIIQAKWAKALRFPRIGGGGAVQSVQYVARGYKIVHTWSPDHLRPHIAPAIEEVWPQTQRELEQVPRKVLEGALL